MAGRSIAGISSSRADCRNQLGSSWLQVDENARISSNRADGRLRRSQESTRVELMAGRGDCTLQLDSNYWSGRHWFRRELPVETWIARNWRRKGAIVLPHALCAQPRTSPWSALLVIVRIRTPPTVALHQSVKDFNLWNKYKKFNFKTKMWLKRRGRGTKIRHRKQTEVGTYTNVGSVTYRGKKTALRGVNSYWRRHLGVIMQEK